jgi:HEAT repeat protein
LIERLVTHEAAHSLAVTELLQQQGPSAVAELIEILDSDAETAAKALAAEALGQIGDLQAVPALLRQCGAAETLQRLAAFKALTALGDPRAAAGAAQALRRDVAEEVRTQAAICLGRIGGRDFAADLEAALADESWWVRYEAASALYALGDEGLSRLQKAAQEPAQPAATIAHELLQEKGLAA